MKIFIHSFLNILFVVLLTSTDAKGENIAVSWEDTFIEKYSKALDIQDTALYVSLLVSQVEIDSLLQELQAKVPNCITDVEKGITVDKLTKQFYQLKDYKTNIRHIDIINNYAINGCGNVQGFKINLKCECTDKITRYRTLTFINIHGINKLMFDIEKK